MNDSDRDLIAALAEGSLPPDEAAALEARIADDPEARAELAAQRTALAALAAAPPARMTAAERNELRRSLAEQLHLEPAPEPTPPARSRFRLNWGAIAVAAAAVFAVVMISPLTSLLRTSDDGSADTTTAAVELAAEAEADSDEALEDTSAIAQRDLAGSDAAAATTALPETTAPPATAAPATTTAATEVTEAPAAAESPLFAALPDGGDITSAEAEDFLAGITSQADEYTLADDRQAVADLIELTPCGTEAGAQAPEALLPLEPLATVRVDGADAVVWGNIAAPDSGRFVGLLSIDGCSVVLTRTELPAP